jgi:GTP cyclohydrolase IA
VSVSDTIRKRLQQAQARYWAGDNISEFINEGELDLLIDEATAAFEDVLGSLVIDSNDPNSANTPRRLAKMYINELMEGRYHPRPRVASFPNDNDADRYTGMLVVRAELKSMCSHHHQPVRGTAYIGIIPGVKVIGLSKYARIAQWCARRGTLQEELTRNIADEIMTATGSEDVGVYIQGTHGCMENRGVCAHSSLTQTCVLRGQFYSASIKQEFYDNIKLQQGTVANAIG